MTALLVLCHATAAGAGNGHDFIQEARLFHEFVACGSEAKARGGLDAKTIERHCKQIRPKVEQFRKRYVTRAQPFFEKWRPKNLPKRVVYPFGGGDLVSALTTFPNATEITTISLEHPGDPRRLRNLPKKRLAKSLELYRLVAGQLMLWNDSASKNLRKMEKGPIPGQLSLFMTALVVYDMEPVSLRFFRIEKDGSLHYFTLAEINALETVKAGKLERRWINTDYSLAFRNMELRFRKRGDPNAPVITHRHIAFNLDNDHFGSSPLRKHLEKKGKIAAMTKAASYLLWMKPFTEIRDYLLGHMVWMASDSTGILPRDARKAGFEQITFGTFEGAYLEYRSDYHSEQMAKMWKRNRRGGLRFRYGYPDINKHYHLMITRPKTK